MDPVHFLAAMRTVPVECPVAIHSLDYPDALIANGVDLHSADAAQLAGAFRVETATR